MWAYVAAAALVAGALIGCMPAVSSASNRAEPTPGPSVKIWTATPISDAGDGQPSAAQEEPTTENTPTATPPDAALQEVIASARDDLAERLGVDASLIDVVEARSVAWPDRSLGCPLPGMAYVQVPVDGLLIRLQADARIYEYHSGAGRPPFLCDPAKGPQGGEAPQPSPGGANGR